MRKRDIINENTPDEGTFPTMSDGYRETFVECIAKHLKKLGVCSCEEEYLSISEAIVDSACVDMKHEDGEFVHSCQLEDARNILLDYFGGVVSECDAKSLIQAAALDAGISLGPTDGNGPMEDAKKCDKTDKDDPDDSDDSGESDHEDDGNYIGEGECELCERNIKLTRHHLIPRATWPRMKKRLWNSAKLIESLNTISDEKELLDAKVYLQKSLGMADVSNLPSFITHSTVRCYLGDVCLLCRQCHSAVHSRLTEWELATMYNTVDQLLEHDEIRKFAKWANKQRPGKNAMR